MSTEKKSRAKKLPYRYQSSARKSNLLEQSGGGGGGVWVCQPISPHYRSEGRRQGSCAVFLAGVQSLKFVIY